jgi:diketogulonate reductase-like aldo/keto reductase
MAERSIHHPQRRHFLKQSAGLLTASLFSPLELMAATDRAIKRPIPRSAELLPIIGMGSSRTFDIGEDKARQAQLAKVLQAFFDHGGALIDSSPMYGRAEQVLGDLLKNTRNTQALFAATKVWTYGKEDGIQQMHRSMKLMGVEVFDLMQIHNLRDWEVHIDTLKEWRAEGKVRYIGITTSHGRYHDELEKVMKSEPLDFVQFTYHINNLEAETRLLPLAKERGIATLINRPFQRGELFRTVRGKAVPAWASEFDCQSWGQFFLKYIASHPAVTCIIPATSKLHHMVDNMAAGYGRLPDAVMRKRMRAYFTSL